MSRRPAHADELDTLVRFMSHVQTSLGCWEWTASKTAHGYGQSGLGGKSELAHRKAYEFFVGPVPEGLHVDHLCRNRGCVNPAHLEAVTQAENNRRRHREQTHCRRGGHPLYGDNLYIYPRGARACRICLRDRNREYKERRRAAIA